jgi:hypothetical protein
MVGPSVISADDRDRQVTTAGVVTLAVIAALIVVSAIGAAGCGGTKATSASPSPVTFTTGPSVAPPAWVQKIARGVAASSVDPKPISCEWVLTTATRAAPLVGLTAQDPSVKADPNLKVYIIIEHGTFNAERVNPLSPPPPATWYETSVEARTKRPRDMGLLNRRPDTSSVGTMNLFTF